jgi:hypothetical protein
MSNPQVTRFLVTVITDAISGGDAPLAETALRVLAAVDPAEAQDVLHIIKAELALCDHGGAA